jgi:hypothetical protein
MYSIFIQHQEGLSASTLKHFITTVAKDFAEFHFQKSRESFHYIYPLSYHRWALGSISVISDIGLRLMSEPLISD